MPRAILLACIALVTPLHPALAGALDPPRSTSVREEWLSELTSGLLAGRVRDSGELLDGLLEGGARSIDGLVAELDRQPGSPSSRTLQLLHGLPGAVLTRIEAQPESSARLESAQRLIGISTLARLGRDGEVDQLIDLCSQRANWSLDSSMRSEFQGALTALLARGPRSYRVLRDRFTRIDPILQTLSLRSIGSIRSRASIELLIELVGRSSRLDVAILSQLNRSARETWFERQGDPLIRIRMALSTGSSEVRREAALCLSALRDYDCLPQLVDLLEDTDASVRKSAHYSLRQLTGFGYDADKTNWQHWVAREAKWWREDAQSCLDQLHGTNASSQLAAVKEVSRNRLHRARVIEHLSFALRSCAPSAARMAALALGKLEARESGSVLVDGLAHQDERVREACHKSLRSLFERELPAERELWREALQK